MKARWLLGLCALLAFPGCFDPIVGSQCAQGYSRCGDKCVVAGTCTLGDASIDALEWETSLEDGGFDLDSESDGALDDAPKPEADAPDADAGTLDDAGLKPVDTSEEDTPGTPEGDASLGVPDGIAGSPDDAVDAPVPSPDRAADTWFDPDLAPYADVSDEDSDDCPDCDGGVDAPSTDAGGLTVVDGADAAEDAGFGLGDADDDAVSDALDAEAGPLVCGFGLSVCGEQCTDLMNDPNNCGICGKTCATGICTEGACLVCPDEAPTWCGSQCTNTASDPDNCGGCGLPCITGLCSNSVCEDAGTGRVIVIGHDYADYNPTRIVKNRIIANAVFMWPLNPVRLLHYVGDATALSVQNVDKAINQFAGSRTILRSYANAADAPLWLPNVDVFLIYPQAHASDATLNQLGTNWASAMSDFVRNRGGTIIVLDADQADNAGTVQILSNAGLMNVTRQASASAPGLVCYATARGDALATGLTKSYSCQANSTTFSLGESGDTITSVVETVLGEAASAPVVISKIF